VVAHPTKEIGRSDSPNDERVVIICLFSLPLKISNCAVNILSSRCELMRIYIYIYEKQIYKRQLLLKQAVR
jgi:hypothetical protein